MTRRRRGRLVRLVAACALVSAGVPWTANAATKSVEVSGTSFNPSQVSIFLDDTVQWRVEDDSGHSITASADSRAANESFDSSPQCASGIIFQRSKCLRNGRSYSHKFTHTGTFTYYCRHHGSDGPYPSCGMCGQVIVTRKPTATKSPTSTSPTSASPTGSGSGTASPTDTASGTGTRTLAGGAGDDANTGPIAIAAVGVVLLAGSGFLVYRTLIARR